MHSISHETHAILNHPKDQLLRTFRSQGPARFIVTLRRKSSISPKNKQTVIVEAVKDMSIRVLAEIITNH